MGKRIRGISTFARQLLRKTMSDPTNKELLDALGVKIDVEKNHQTPRQSVSL